MLFTWFQKSVADKYSYFRIISVDVKTAYSFQILQKY